MSRVRSVSLAVAGVVAGLVLASCGGSADGLDTSVAEPAAVVTLVEEGATVIDVRTPEEFAGGHLAGALNIDVSAPSFEDRVRTLDPGREYVVYCRSGSRAGQAMEKMADLGFADVTNGGAFADLAAAGAEVG